ncbi:uncharacterized protein DS421_4g127040 [Arachis hypogaea]|uniref:Uncharacterized protein n=1 Tax=Arachis hypogaea TaxID=3818 RepID=A0A445DEK1_ARAHY|nr:uncharacterized protein DS421_4g127040 [Arachis hypogaea]RYR61618.1 hypothetical protein Ahy_A04g018809 isoform B [Arachis hypogaea]
MVQTRITVEDGDPHPGQDGGGMAPDRAAPQQVWWVEASDIGLDLGLDPDPGTDMDSEVAELMKVDMGQEVVLVVVQTTVTGHQIQYLGTEVQNQPSWLNLLAPTI